MGQLSSNFMNLPQYPPPTTTSLQPRPRYPRGGRNRGYSNQSYRKNGRGHSHPQNHPPRQPHHNPRHQQTHSNSYDNQYDSRQPNRAPQRHQSHHSRIKTTQETRSNYRKPHYNHSNQRPGSEDFYNQSLQQPQLDTNQQYEDSYYENYPPESNFQESYHGGNRNKHHNTQKQYDASSAANSDFYHEQPPPSVHQHSRASYEYENQQSQQQYPHQQHQQHQHHQHQSIQPRYHHQKPRYRRRHGGPNRYQNRNQNSRLQKPMVFHNSTIQADDSKFYQNPNPVPRSQPRSNRHHYSQDYSQQNNTNKQHNKYNQRSHYPDQEQSSVVPLRSNLQTSSSSTNAPDSHFAPGHEPTGHGTEDLFASSKDTSKQPPPLTHSSPNSNPSKNMRFARSNSKTSRSSVHSAHSGSNNKINHSQYNLKSKNTNSVAIPSKPMVLPVTLNEKLTDKQRVQAIDRQLNLIRQEYWRLDQHLDLKTLQVSQSQFASFEQLIEFNFQQEFQLAQLESQLAKSEHHGEIYDLKPLVPLKFADISEDSSIQSQDPSPIVPSSQNPASSENNTPKTQEV